MPAPKRRAGETQEEFNRRRIAYYANRRALNDAFYNNEEDVDIRDLTAGSPNSNGAVVSDMDINGDEDWDNFVRSKAPKPSRLRNPANSNRFYAEDRRQSSRRPSGDRNIWDGVDGPSGYVYDDFVVDDSWIRRNADTAESASRSPAVRNGEQRVMEKNDRNISAKMNPGKRAVLTPGDYTKKIGNYKKESISGSTPVAKLNPIKRDSALSASTNNTEQKGNRKEVREGTMNRMGSSPRQTLENGFREEEEKKKKSGSTGFKGIRP